MNKNDLDILLNKFYSGETSLDEEELLRKELAGDDADAALLQALEQVEDEVKVPSGMQSSLSDMIDEWESQEGRKAKVVPLFRRPSAWAVAALVAVIAAVGWWLMRNNRQPTPKDDNPQIIAKIEENINSVSNGQSVTIRDENIQPEQQPQQHSKPQSRSHVKPASAYINNVEHIAQAQVSPQEEPELTASDEEIAIAALEKFSTVLNKGMDQLDDANEKINEINNTVQQNLI